MSVIALQINQDAGKIEIAADTIDIWGETKQYGDKLWEICPGFVLGSVGRSSINTLVKTYAHAHMQRIHGSESSMILFAQDFHSYCKQYGLDSNDNVLLIARYGLAWRIKGLDVKQIHSYDAIGSGRDFALAAMFLGMNPNVAVDTACKLSTQCGGVIRRFTVALNH